MTFSEWMAREDHPRTKAFHVNLVRRGYERASAAEFAALLNPALRDRFRRLTWEGVYRFFAGNPALDTMRRYLQTKTAGLVPAFRLRRDSSNYKRHHRVGHPKGRGGAMIDS